MEENHPLLNDSKNFHIFYNAKTIRNLLHVWGFSWSKNKSRPYVNGHEGVDVVESLQ
jgi:transposase